MASAETTYTDRQARAIIVAAEEHGFEREPDLYVRWYDADLHADARYAAEFLDGRHPEELAKALVAPDPLAAEVAAERIAAKGITLADARRLTEAASARGFVPPQDDPPLFEAMLEFEQAEAAIAFFWTTEPDELRRLIGDLVDLAPIPETARFPCRCFPQRDADYY